MSYDNNNIFARILRGELPCFKVYEDEFTLAFMDIMPQADGHTLVIPKHPAVTLLELPADVAAKTLQTVQKVMAALKTELGAEGVVLMQLNGTAAGQTVPHVHFHLIPEHLSRLRAHGVQQGDMEKIKSLADKIKQAL